MMILSRLAEEIHRNTTEKGFGDQEFGMLIALAHSELSEALEDWRHNRPHMYYEIPQDAGSVELSNQEYDELQQRVKGRIQAEPRGIGIELADVIIRVLDLCAKEGIDIDEAVKRKMAYNRIRPYRHGGKRS